MAIIAKAILKGWFSAGKYPTGAQFGSLIDSLRHKSETIEINEVKNLADTLNEKCGKTWGEKVAAVCNKMQSKWEASETEEFTIGAGMRARIRILMGINGALDIHTVELSYEEIVMLRNAGWTVIDVEGKGADGTVRVIYSISAGIVDNTLILSPTIEDAGNMLIKLSVELSNPIELAKP